MNANRELIERFEKKIWDALGRVWGENKEGWAGGVKHGNLAQLFADPFLRCNNLCRKLLCRYHSREDGKVVVTPNQASEDSKSAMEN